MTINFENLFWEKFDKNFKLNYLLILAAFSREPFQSKLLIISIDKSKKNVADFYCKIAALLLEQENLENDLRIIEDIHQLNLYSLNLKNLFLAKSFHTIYSSIDSVYISKYKSNSYNTIDHFSYLLGNYVRYHEENKILLCNEKRSYILIAIVNIFSYGNYSVKLTFKNSINNSSIEINNKPLLERLNHQKTLY